MYKLNDFDFSLPPDLIAQSPLNPRDDARLLHVAMSGLNEYLMSDLPSLLLPGDLLIANDTKVIPAQLYGKINGKNIGFTLHKQISEDTWLAFAKPVKRCSLGAVAIFSDDFEAYVIERRNSGEIKLKFNLSNKKLIRMIEKIGKMPLPPYIKRNRNSDITDSFNYQTLFANKLGAVAAPTAGLHFTPRLRKAVVDCGANIEMITLHVGAGTFLPVKTETISEHKIHTEWGEVTLETANRINETKNKNGRIICIGTTSLRLIESVWSKFGEMQAFKGDIDLFITPGYSFNVADLLMTNFHLPKSTLLMLVSAFAGFEEIKTAYQHAIEQKYRFFSYGDGCLLEKKNALEKKC